MLKYTTPQNGVFFFSIWYTDVCMMKTKGFTLIELLVVVGIIGILASIVIVGLNKSQSKARDARRRAEKNQIITAMNMYYTDNGSWPMSNGSGAIWTCFGPTASTCWAGLGGYTGSDSLMNNIEPYLKRIPLNNATPGTRAYDRLLYVSNYAGLPPNYVTGAYLLWMQENPIAQSDCRDNGYGVDQYAGDPYYYCYEYLGP
jgi:prepilin-type N-terminal cleavage/methylation domain-containing protein